MNNTDRTDRLTHLTNRLLALTPADLDWVRQESDAQLAGFAADNIEVDYLDALENALDLAADPTYPRDI